jgi:hypothetical protein
MGAGRRRVLGSSPRPLRPGRPSPSAAGAVGLPGGGDPVLLLYRPAAVGLLDARLGHVYPAKPVGLADIHRWSTCSRMTAILPRSAHPGTETPWVLLSRAKVLHPLSAMDFGEHSSCAAWGLTKNTRTSTFPPLLPEGATIRATPEAQLSGAIAQGGVECEFG